MIFESLYCFYIVTLFLYFFSTGEKHILFSYDNSDLIYSSLIFLIIKSNAFYSISEKVLYSVFLKKSKTQQNL